MMNIVDRLKKILFQPATEWPVIAAEPIDTRALFLGYAAPLAAIAPLAAWVGHSVIGVSVPLFGTVRTPFLSGLAFAIVSYALALVGVFVVGLIIDALAPTFGGEKNQGQAMKCAVYSYTPAWVAGILYLFPMLELLGLVASLYGIYLCYLGLPVLMKAPREKAAGYTFVVILCAIVLSVLLSIVGGLLGFAGGADRLGAGDAMFGHARETAPVSDSVLGKLDTLEKKLDESNRKMEEASRKGDAAGAATAAMESIATMASGGKKVEPIGVDRLKQFLPEALDGMPRSNLSTEQTSFGPMSVTTASATYHDGNRKVRLNVGDMAAAGGLFALTALMGAGQTRETDAGYEKMQRVDGRFVIEKQDKRSGAAEYSVVLADRFIVNASSDNVEATGLRAMIAKLDTSKLEAMKDVGVAK